MIAYVMAATISVLVIAVRSKNGKGATKGPTIQGATLTSGQIAASVSSAMT
jgi:hypothetical protein